MNADQKKELKEIIERIAEVATRKHKAIHSQLEIRDKINIIRSKFLLDIALIKDDKGKPFYATEQLREAALVLKLDKDDEYKKLREELMQLLEESNLASIEQTKLTEQKSLLLLDIGIAPSALSIDTNPE